MGGNSPTRDELIQRVQEVAARLGKQTIARSEFTRETGIIDYHVTKHFDSWTDLIETAGLEPYTVNRRVDDDELLAAMRDAFVTGSGIVTRTRLQKLCRYGFDTYAKRWGRWPNVLLRFREWVELNDPDFPYLSDLPSPEDAGFTTTSNGVAPDDQPQATTTTSWLASSRTKYGPFLNFRGLQHAPINEQGVVFLFGMVAFDLGYVVEGVGTGFPDCEAKRSVSRSGDVWERVRIEFEYRSRNFLAHGHRAEDCDVLVCWEHDWPECPIEVLELRTSIETLEN